MPEAAVDAGRDYENQLMVGNGPYTHGVAAHRRGDRPRQERQLGRRLQRQHLGPATGSTSCSASSADADTSYNGLEAGEGDTARIPSGRTAEAVANWGTTTDDPDHGFVLLPVQRAPTRWSAARRTSSCARRSRRRSTARPSTTPSSTAPAPWPTGITPEGIPGYTPDLCEYCTYDPDAAQAAFDEWTAAGNVQSEPIPIQYGAGGVHGDVVQLIIDNLAPIGIQAVPDERDTTTYFSAMADGACVFCRSGWIADYPTYDNFMFDLFAPAARRQQLRLQQPDVRRPRRPGQGDRRPDASRRRCSTRPRQCCSTTTSTRCRSLFYRGEYAYDAERLQNFHQTPRIDLIPWEQITITDS